MSNDCVLIKQKTLNDLRTPIEELKQKAFDECEVKYRKMLQDRDGEIETLKYTVKFLKEEILMWENKPIQTQINPLEMRLSIMHTQMHENKYDRFGCKTYTSSSVSTLPIDTFNFKLEDSLRKQLNRMKRSLSEYFVKRTEINIKAIQDKMCENIAKMSFFERRKFLKKYEA